ncbi:MAG: biotin-dependent carboxyltransferase family protein [Desulfobulbaceae bacterium]|nr:biotin-dependent carboxyltransferase family protein [Desulfobulbaceae bacterium]
MSAALRIINPGACTTVQDLGRPGQAHLGVPVSGALDDYAHRVANWLVGNPPSCATLEMTMVGAEIEVLIPCQIALAGADMDLVINGQPMLQWQSYVVNKSDRIRLGLAKNGCRTYLAVSGGIDCPQVLASRSTCLSGRLGGYEGRMLKAGDILACGRPAATEYTKRRLPWSPRYTETIVVRAISGPQDDWFTQHNQLFFASIYSLSPQSNRMGCRLQGPAIIRDTNAPENLLSIPIAAGNVQIPADGQPIVLFREQTIGGYPCIATVLSCDLWRLAQAQPGATVHFTEVSLEGGQKISSDWHRFFAAIENSTYYVGVENLQ